MKYQFWLNCLVFSILTFPLAAQQIICLEGNCDNGFGKARQVINDSIVIGTYKGEFRYHKFHGKGKFTFNNGNFYEGQFKSGLYNGSGVLVRPDGTVDAGIWEDHVLVERDEKIKASLKCLDGNCKDGNGKSIDYKGREYEGQFKDGKYHGFGKMVYSGGDYYEGNWKEGLPHGEGSRYLRNGHTISGPWENGHSLNDDIETYAVVVGVADYYHFNKLTYTIADAKRFHAFLKSPEGGAVPEENLALLLDSVATKNNIINTIYDVYEMADSNDIVIFYFAGHGLENAFLPIDFKEDDPSTRLNHASIATAINDCASKFQLVIADACHSGSFMISYEDYKNNGYSMPAMATRSSSKRDIISQYKKSFQNVNRKGFAMLLSSATEEISLETTKFEQGVFSYFLINGLKGYADANGDKIITVKELADFVEENVRKFTYNFQTPQHMALPKLTKKEKANMTDERFQQIVDHFMNNMPVGFSSLEH
jgi:hypothetical protein